MKTLTLLLVDDNGHIRDSLRSWFERLGFNVIIGINSTTGLDRFSKNKCDVVVTDYEMPDMTGLEMVAQIKAASPNTPIVLRSASRFSSTPPNIDLCLQKGSNEDDDRLEAYLLDMISKS